MPARPSLDLRAYPWEQCYATSDLRPDGQPVDILRDFYIPALSRATRDDGVGGYFTSTSLAAASQVSSRFVEQSGKARFVDGLQLTPEDAEAILQGHQHRAAEPMLAAVEGVAECPSSVRQGEELSAQRLPGWTIAVSRRASSAPIAGRVRRNCGPSISPGSAPREPSPLSQQPPSRRAPAAVPQPAGPDIESSPSAAQKPASEQSVKRTPAGASASISTRSKHSSMMSSRARRSWRASGSMPRARSPKRSSARVAVAPSTRP